MCTSKMHPQKYPDAPSIHYADLVETRSPEFKNEDSECLLEGG